MRFLKLASLSSVEAEEDESSFLGGLGVEPILKKELDLSLLELLASAFMASSFLDGTGESMYSLSSS